MKHIDLLINENNSINEAMEKISKNGKGILFVVNETNQLLGSLSDGDIRRAIVSGKLITDSIFDLYNKEPKYISYYSKYEIERLSTEYSIRTIPLVDQDNKLLAIFHDGKQLERTDSLKDIPIVIMAGGLGTRLYPYTKILPKPLIPIGDIPIIERIMNQFELFGCRKFYIIVNHKKNMIISYFSDTEKKYDIEFVCEDSPLGTAGGLSLLRDRIKSDFILTNCDTIVNDDFCKIVTTHQDKCNILTMIGAKKNVVIPYGVISEKDGEIKRIIEKPSFDFLINTGIYISSNSIFGYIEDNEVISMPDVCKKVMKANGSVGIFTILEQNWLDMGQLDELENMREKFI